MTEASKIAENTIKSAVNGEEILVKSLWENEDCVITFFRRFGCAFCRLSAKQLSGIKPQLDANKIRLVGVGVDDIGVKEFLDGKFFDGDLFIDVGKKSYDAMGYKKYGYLTLLPALFTKTSRDALAEAKKLNVGGDLKGDYYQVGGTLVVKKGGEEVLLSHKQVSLADHINPAEILKCFNIEAPPDSKEGEKVEQNGTN